MQIVDYGQQFNIIWWKLSTSGHFYSINAFFGDMVIIKCYSKDILYVQLKNTVNIDRLKLAIIPRKGHVRPFYILNLSLIHI